MKPALTSILFALLTMSALAAEKPPVAVAKVDYREIEDLLTTVVLNVDGNQELRDRYNSKKQASKDAQEKMEAAIMKGEEVNPVEAALSSMHGDEDQKKVERLCEKHLLELIEQVFDGKYEIIFKDDYRSSLIYARSAIDDVTVVIKQELLKEVPKN